MTEARGHCPICNANLVASVLTCTDCGTEFSNQFRLNKYSYLRPQELEFLEAFLSAEGNLKQVQQEFKISYQIARRRLTALLRALDLQRDADNTIDIIDLSDIDVNSDSTRASDIVRNALLRHGGITMVQSQSGNEYRIRISRDGTSFETEALPIKPPYEFRVFDIVADFLYEMGGKARKGNGRNSKYGEGECTDDTVVGRIARDYLKIGYGKSTYDPVMVLNAIMTWAGITEFVRGEMQLSTDYMMRRTAALREAETAVAE